MGGPNKLLAEVDGAPMVAHAARAALASHAARVVAVLGHKADEIKPVVAALVPKGASTALRHNPDFAEGLDLAAAPAWRRSARHRRRDRASATCPADRRASSTG